METRSSAARPPSVCSILDESITKLGYKFHDAALPENELLSHVSWMNVEELSDAEKNTYEIKEIQPLVLIIQWLFEGIKNVIQTWWHKAEIQEENEVLLQCHFLKNNGHLSPKTFLELKKNIHDAKRFKELTNAEIDRLKESGFIDTKAYRAMKSLLVSERTKDVWIYVNTISVLNQLTDNIETVKELLGPKEALELYSTLESAYKTSIFENQASSKLQNLLARVQITLWMNSFAPEQDGMNREDSFVLKDLRRSLAKDDQKGFQEALKDFYEYHAETTSSPLQGYYYQEMAASLKNLINGNVFVHLSHALMTETYVNQWSQEFASLHKKILSLDDNSIDKEQLNQLKEKLSKLYSIFGHVLEGEKEFLSSDIFYSKVYGDLRQRWQEISDKLHQFNGGEISAHEMCGCINQKLAENASKPWPQTATTVLNASNNDRAFHSDEPLKKKVLSFTCTWGGGHKAAASALEQYLGKKNYHFTSVDLPQETLLSEDPLQKLLGGNFSIAKLHNTLCANKAFKTVEMIRKLGSKMGSTAICPTKRRLVMQRILMERPDVIFVNYSAHLDILLSVAEELGIPVVYQATDLHQTYDNWTIKPNSKHFKLLIPAADEKIWGSFKAPVGKDQVVNLGYPSRPEFIKDYSAEALDKIYEKYELPKDKKLVMMMNGALGSDYKTSQAKQIISQLRSGKYDDAHFVVVCGKSVDLFRKLKSELKRHNLEHKMTVCGFISDPEDMAKLMNVSQCIVTKPGGGTVAEALYTKLRMVLERGPKNGLPWEDFTCDWIENKGLGQGFRSTKGLIKALDAELSKPKSTIDFRPEVPQPKAYFDLVNQMIEAAEKDKDYFSKRKSWSEELSVPFYASPEAAKGYRIESAQIQLNQALKEGAFAKDFSISKEVERHLFELKPVALNFKNMKLEKAEKFSQVDSLLFTQKLTSQFESLISKDIDRLIPSKQSEVKLEKLLVMTSFFLKQMNLRFENGKISKKQLIKEISKLDRLALLLRIKMAQAQRLESEEAFDAFKWISERLTHLNKDETDRKKVVSSLSMLYETKIAREDLSKWLLEKTSRARKNKTEEYILGSKEAILSFVLHPLSIDFVKDLKIHRSVSAYNQKLEVSKTTGDLKIKVNGRFQRVAKVKDSYSFFQNRIVNKEGKEVVYTERSGLKNGTFVDWDNKIPVFLDTKTPREKPALEIRTVLGKESHAYIRVYATDGKVYSVGKFWDRDVNLPGIEGGLLKTIPAMLSVDLHEFLPEESDIKATTIDLTEDQFTTVMNEIVEVQKNFRKQEGGYNLMNANCTDFVRHIAGKVGLKIDTKISVFEYLTSISRKRPKLRKLLYKNKWIRYVSNVFLYPIALATNMLLYMLGAHKVRGEAGLRKARILKSWKDIIDPFSGSVDHPQTIRTWQEIREETLRSA